MFKLCTALLFGLVSCLGVHHVTTGSKPVAHTPAVPMPKTTKSLQMKKTVWIQINDGHFTEMTLKESGATLADIAVNR